MKDFCLNFDRFYSFFSLFSAVCDFETDMCGYTQPAVNPNLDSVQWKRWANLTSTYGSGPATDHTTRNGYGQFDFLLQNVENADNFLY